MSDQPSETGDCEGRRRPFSWRFGVAGSRSPGVSNRVASNVTSGQAGLDGSCAEQTLVDPGSRDQASDQPSPT